MVLCIDPERVYRAGKLVFEAFMKPNDSSSSSASKALTRSPSPRIARSQTTSSASSKLLNTPLLSSLSPSVRPLSGPHVRRVRTYSTQFHINATFDAFELLLVNHEAQLGI